MIAEQKRENVKKDKKSEKKETVEKVRNPKKAIRRALSKAYRLNKFVEVGGKKDAKK